MQSKLKLPQSGGAKRASKIFEKMRKKIPSDNLVKIISEVPELETDKKTPLDKAAKDVEL